MSQNSEIIGSFTRVGNFPIEANYVFETEEALKQFYSDPIAATTVHEGLLKVVKSGQNGKQTLYWAEKKENNTFEFKEVIGNQQIINIDNNLSETSENPVQNKVITEQINNINKVLFPLNISVSGGGLFEKRTTQDITVSWDVKKGNNNIVPDTITVNDVNVNNTSKFKQFNSVTSNTTYTVKAIKDNVTVGGSVSAIFVNPSYFGAVSDSFIPTEDNIKELSKNVKNTKNYTGITTLDNGKVCYAYPKSFGALTSIKDSNGFEYIQSYVRTELTIWGESYWVYVLKDATTIDDFKQIYL